jgi:hypothetical protein
MDRETDPENAQPSSSQVIHFGRHKASFQPPDIVRVWWVGEASADEARAFLDQCEQWCGERRYFLIADQTQLTQITAEARKVAAGDPRAVRVAGIAVLGAGYHIRVISALIATARRLMANGNTGGTEFFSTDAQALTWIATERKRLELR